MLNIDVNEKHCLYLRKKRKKGTWKVMCSRGDPQCHGDNECNVVECKNLDKAKQIGSGIKTNKNL